MHGPDGDYASGKALAEIALPEGLEHIGTGTFFACEALEEITLPESLQSVDEHTFRACTSLSRAVVLGDLPALTSRAFFMDGEPRPRIVDREGNLVELPAPKEPPAEKPAAETAVPFVIMDGVLVK